MPSVTLRQLAQESKIPNEQLAKLIRQLLAEQTVEWNKTLRSNYPGRTEAGAELEMAYHQGRAHAMCEILGDQTDLHWFLERLEGMPEEKPATLWRHMCGSCQRVWDDEDENYKVCPSCGRARDYFPSVDNTALGRPYVGKDKGLSAVLDEPPRRARSVVDPTNPLCDSWE